MNTLEGATPLTQALALSIVKVLLDPWRSRPRYHIHIWTVEYSLMYNTFCYHYRKQVARCYSELLGCLLSGAITPVVQSHLRHLPYSSRISSPEIHERNCSSPSEIRLFLPNLFQSTPCRIPHPSRSQGARLGSSLPLDHCPFRPEPRKLMGLVASR